ncbi:cytochrome c oxidase subunit II [Novosphingobium sp. SCN 63-17]|uniref:cytochrome c oxidase subunit II n=1 Tax=Novosphingobium sp. SCN 63-17 TaxID=1660120 RepID=UPI00086CD248|nr:cytochrome c oxidase subunit II [Novosphingobium sp. SCN 63-17]ODU81496.1 MAG: cytochrome c oxidase subunit II [Novosphingobium sp. SCN 63-17]
MGKAIRTLGVAAALAFAPQVMAAPAAAPVAAATAPAADAVQPAAKADAGAEKSSYVPAKPTPGKGQPVAGALSFQDQYSITGQQALRMYDYVLMPIITVITLFVLGLLLFVMARFRRGANPVASKTSHNTLIEVIWTLLPVLILVVIAVPSIRLLAAQYTPAPKNALTVKATGYQWYWGYTYPDNGGFEVISNMLPDEEALKRGEPPQLGADARMVVPYGEPIRMQTVGADVIHSFAVPSLWFKLDAVPGRINEKELFIKEPGVYYGQCSELCGVRHGYMPIVVEAVSRPQFEAWVKAQGGTVGPKEAAPAAAPAAAAPAADASAPAADASASPAA